MSYLIAGIFLPLFPFSMLFNMLYARIPNPVLKGLCLLVWPQIGLFIVFGSGVKVTTGLAAWAVFTSLLYAFRAVALRELHIWTGFIGTSSWALIWILIANDVDSFQLRMKSVAICVPLVLLTFLGAGLERRFGAAYVGLYGGLAQSIPRFAGMLVLVVLAIVATPLFPSFFIMISMIIKTLAVSPVMAIGIGIVWLLWSWAGTKMLSGLIAGRQINPLVDLGQGNMWFFIAVLFVLVFTGVFWLGSMS